MKRVIAALIVIAVAGITPTVHGEEDPLIRCQTLAPNDPDPLRRDSYDGGSARVLALTLDGADVLVLLPRDYEGTERRYPVLYLLQGA